VANETKSNALLRVKRSGNNDIYLLFSSLVLQSCSVLEKVVVWALEKKKNKNKNKNKKNPLDCYERRKFNYLPDG